MNRGKPGTVRIIGGRWRGRRLPVADLPGLRPSGDRSRETLFNWLQGVIRGARCVDLFAGTGALGLEAASRGAAHVVLLERAAPAARAIEEAVERLRGEAAESAGPELQVRRGDALRWLETCEAASIDIAFVDPPFGAGLETRVLALLGERACLAPGGLVYLETARQAAPPLPAGWRVAREKVLGDVRMQLLEWTSAPSVSDTPDTPG